MSVNTMFERELLQQGRDAKENDTDMYSTEVEGQKTERQKMKVK